ncbi:MAG: sigma-54-dependent Fis family transcriptional regulator [Deltaproteobacteria bacterium]|nr:sigma-54-dependent Fis family transcriptional regulator [Deltaproteobacteria bacterium]
MSKGRILVIDDEYLIRWSLQQNLVEHGYEVFMTASAEEGLAVMEREDPDLVLLDIQLPGMSGMELLRGIKKTRPECAVVMITATSDLSVAVRAMKDGAFDYLPKPFNLDEVRITVDKALETRRLKDEVTRYREKENRQYGFHNIIYRSREMEEVLGVGRKIAQSDATTVLITGESGTGKDLLAQAIHYESKRRDMPFMPVNCTALPIELLESELMGHEKGAFTDAKSLKKGQFELMDGGTLFLDEIGDMPMALQAKILRFLENWTFKRVGGTRDITVDVRVIAATNKDLEERIREQAFREDLYYRLNVIPINIPPLRERPEDVAPLAEHFLVQFNRDLGKEVKEVTREAVAAMEAYSWPGNVRELKNVIERAMILSAKDAIGAEDLSLSKIAPALSAPVIEGKTLNLDETEKVLIERALEQSRENQSGAARLLGISRDTLRYRMKKHKLL